MSETRWTKINRNGNRVLKKGKIYVVAFLTVLVIVGIPLFAFSYEQVDFNEYGLRKDMIQNTIEPKIYEEGLHLIGFWCDFIKFPSTYITVEFTPAAQADDIPISVQTKNGLLVKVDVSFQFKVRKSDVLEMYEQYGTAYRDYVTNVARSALREVVGGYDAETLYANRSAVISAMSVALYDSINDIVDVGEFQLRHIDFPDSFEEAVEAYEVWRIEVEIAQLEQLAEIIRQETLTLVAEFEANRTIIEYEGIADALESLRESLNMTTDELLTYLWIQVIYEHDQAYLFIGLTDFPLLIPLNETL